jgi:hypothetical protein
MAVKSQKDFFSGLVFVVVGVAFAWGATNYKVGDAPAWAPVTSRCCSAFCWQSWGWS